MGFTGVTAIKEAVKVESGSVTYVYDDINSQYWTIQKEFVNEISCESDSECNKINCNFSDDIETFRVCYSDYCSCLYGPYDYESADGFKDALQ